MSLSYSRINDFQIGTDCFLVFVRNIFCGIVYHIDNTPLNTGDRKYGANRTGKVGHSVHADNQVILYPMTALFILHAHSELEPKVRRPFGFTYPRTPLGTLKIDH
jgi:hypothetical protein